MIAYHEEQEVSHISLVAIEDDNGEIVGRFRFGYDPDRFEGRGEFGELIVSDETQRAEIEEATSYLLDWRSWMR